MSKSVPKNTERRLVPYRSRSRSGTFQPNFWNGKSCCSMFAGVFCVSTWNVRPTRVHP